MLDAAEAIARLATARVLCVGDVMLDRFVTGEVERISPEAPVAIMRQRRVAEMLGGVGNVGRNIAAAGASAMLIAAIGKDDAGTALTRVVDDVAGLDGEILLDDVQPTTIKTRFLAESHHLLRVDIDPTGPYAAATYIEAERAFDTHLEACGAVVISDYGKGFLSPELIARLIAKTRSASVPVVVDPKSADYSVYRGASVVTPNRKELSLAAGRKVAGDDDIVRAASDLCEAFSIDAMLVTRSEEGMTLVRGMHEPVHLKTAAAEVYDVAGAGDTVVALVAAALAAGLPLETAMVLANAAAGIVVRKSGTAVAYPSELRAAIGARNGGKLLTAPDATDLVASWRAEGRRIGFTNGCFDILHAGHVQLLRTARASVDRLVLGLNSDRSVRELKGEGRPVNDEVARAHVLSALAAVDAIVIFDEPTPDALIRALRPDVLMKGGDYTVETVVGAPFVQSYGGDVVLIDLVEGFSTTGTIRKLVSATAR